MKLIMMLIMLLGRDHTTTTDQYDDDIHNPENREYVEEVAFNEGISYEEVTQEMFNARYK